MTDTTKQRPVETLRDGMVKAAIWKNESENGTFFNVTFARSYRNSDGGFSDGDSFSGTQLLQLARLAEKAYDRTRELASTAKSGAEDETGDNRQDA